MQKAYGDAQGSVQELDVELFSQTHLASPWPPLLKIAEHEPVFWSERLGGWLITRHADVKAAYADRRLSAARMDMYFRQLPPQERDGYPTLLKYHRLSIAFLDEPAHMRIRVLMMKAFTRSEVDNVRPLIERITREILDVAGRARDFDFVAAISSQLPTRVIQGMLGVGADQSQEFFGLASAVIRAMGSAAPSSELMTAADAAVTRLNQIFGALIEERRRLPADDLLSALVHARDADDRLSDDELLAACHTIIEAGAETTAHMLAVAFHVVAGNPALEALVSRDPASATLVIDELLRYPGLVKGMTRLVATPFEWHGRALQTGEIVYMMNCAANVDARVFADPFEIRPGRSERASLAFGPGFHSCIGSFLARAELSHFLYTVFQEFEVRIPQQEIRFVPSYVFRGYERLEVRLEPREARRQADSVIQSGSFT